jgi:hypothetical protein
MSKDNEQPAVISLGTIDDCVDKIEAMLLMLEGSSQDPRWAAIARTHFQQAFMASRAVVFSKGRKL